MYRLGRMRKTGSNEKKMNSNHNDLTTFKQTPVTKGAIVLLSQPNGSTFYTTVHFNMILKMFENNKKSI